MTKPDELQVRVDYDLTLFDTDAFATDLWALLADEAGVSAATVNADSSRFHVDPKLGGYMYDDHVASYGLRPAHMWPKLHELIASRDYLYGDSVAFMESQWAYDLVPRILTFGEDRFQRAKLLPYLSKLVSAPTYTEADFDIVFRKKGAFIADAHAGQRGVLIDDVPNQQLPAGFVEVHIDRTLDIDEPIEKLGGFTVATLAQADQVIKSL